MISFDCDSEYFYEIEGLVYFDDIFKVGGHQMKI